MYVMAVVKGLKPFKGENNETSRLWSYISMPGAHSSEFS